MHIAAYGFDAVELFATRAHFDYHDTDAVQRLGEWLSDTRLELHSLHAPICKVLKNGNTTSRGSTLASASTTGTRT